LSKLSWNIKFYGINQDRNGSLNINKFPKNTVLNQSFIRAVRPNSFSLSKYSPQCHFDNFLGNFV